MKLYTNIHDKNSLSSRTTFDEKTRNGNSNSYKLYIMEKGQKIRVYTQIEVDKNQLHLSDDTKLEDSAIINTHFREDGKHYVFINNEKTEVYTTLQIERRDRVKRVSNLDKVRRKINEKMFDSSEEPDAQNPLRFVNSSSTPAGSVNSEIDSGSVDENSVLLDIHPTLVDRIENPFASINSTSSTPMTDNNNSELLLNFDESLKVHFENAFASVDTTSFAESEDNAQQYTNPSKRQKFAATNSSSSSSLLALPNQMTSQSPSQTTSYFPRFHPETNLFGLPVSSNQNPMNHNSTQSSQNDQKIWFSWLEKIHAENKDNAQTPREQQDSNSSQRSGNRGISYC